jgi:pimeloyl-ACP methyl ester carboxylesterase
LSIIEAHMQVIMRAALAAFAFFLLLPAQAQNLGAAFRSERHEFPVVIAGIPCNVVGYLYYLGTFRNRPLQVAVHGATYDHTYWDFPSVNGQDYSYARYMAHRGYAVLAIDQVGAGESCRPDGLTVVHLQNTASALVQVLMALRGGTSTIGSAFDRIALVGHSAGSINAIAAQAATGSQLANALVVTASRHLAVDPLPVGVQAVLPLVPTLMTLPYFPLDAATRAFLFYDAAHADPAVIAVDNALAEPWTGGQVGSTFVAFVYPYLGLPPFHGVNAVTGPVLIQLGENDALFPASRPEDERAFWASTQPRIESLPDMGHDFNLHLTRESSWRGIDSWLRQVLR